MKTVYDIKMRVYPGKATSGPSVVRDFIGVEAEDEASAMLKVFLRLDDEGHKNVSLISCTQVIEGGGLVDL